MLRPDTRARRAGAHVGDPACKLDARPNRFLFFLLRIV